MASPEILKTGEINPELAALFATLPPMPQPPPPPSAAENREALASVIAAATAAVSPPTPSVVEESITIPSRDGFDLPVKIYRPASTSSATTGGEPAGGRPLVVMFHGGGFVSGVHDDLHARIFVSKFGVICVDVLYRHAPESPYPGPVLDCWDGLKWAAANAASLGADPAKGFLTFGISAGGNLAITTAYLALDERLDPPLTGVVAQIPALIDPRTPPEEYKELYVANEQNKDAPFFNRTLLDFFLEQYKLPVGAPLYSPFTRSSLGGLPPVFLQACGLDPLRDDAIIFERALKDHAPDVKVELKVYPGVVHGFSFVFPEWEVAKRYTADTVEGMGKLLGM